MVPVLTLCALALNAPVTHADHAFMQAARYHALSARPDPQAAGGFYEGGVSPEPLSRFASWKQGFGVRVRRGEGGTITVEVMNASGEDVWVNASDSNLPIYLEAKGPNGAWSTIEYHVWSWCGNSRHRVLLPSGQGWRFSSPVSEGAFKTRIRAVLAGDRPAVSNEIEATIPRERFRLDPETAKTMRLARDGAAPTLVPKSRNGGG